MAKSALLVALAFLVLFSSLLQPCTEAAAALFHEPFDTMEDWVISKSRSTYGKVALSSGSIVGDYSIQKGLKLLEDKGYYALSKKLPVPIATNQTYVVSFSVKNEQAIKCSGFYIKLFGPDFDQEKLDSNSPYLFMFGGDICDGEDRLHMIRRYKGENVNWRNRGKVEKGPLTHFYTVVFRTDNTYTFYVDGVFRWENSIEAEWKVLPDPEIADPNDVRPSNWIDTPFMSDPYARKPADWDESEPLEIRDPTDTKPADWDTATRGEWEPRMMRNPKYKGPWRPRDVANPSYRGPWVPRFIPNPEYRPDPNLYQLEGPIAYVGIEVLQLQAGTIFDDIMIGHDPDEVLSYIKNYMQTTGKKEKDALRQRDEVNRREEEQHKADVASAEIVQLAFDMQDGNDL